MPYVTTTKGELFYTMSQGPSGSPALILIHGAGETRLHWPAELRQLPESTVYTLDLPGHGRSEGIGCDTIDDYAKILIAFLDAVGVEQAIPTGHSMGGAIAMTLALDHADLLAGLILIATGARLRVAPAILEGIERNFEETVERITHFAWSSEAPQKLIELGKQALLEAGPEVLLNDLTACEHFDVMERLGEIDVPTLVIGGTADQLTPIKYAHFLAEAINGAQIVALEGSGHMIMLEQPAEVEKTIRGFIAGITS